MTTPTRRLTAVFSALLLATSTLTTSLAQAASDPERLAAGYEATAEALEKIAQVAPAADFNPAELATTIEGDPAAVTAWVTAHIAHGVYRGTLKGAQGTLEDRRGNALDRALLLAALLQAKGLEVRLARATLSADTAAKLAAAIASETHVAAPPVDPALTDPIIEALVADPRVNGAAWRDGAAARDAAADAADAASAVLKDKALNALSALVTPSLAVAEDATALLADHWWVQTNWGGGWADYDPDAAVIGAQTPAKTLAIDAVPESEQHRVTIRVAAETAAPDGALTATPVLEHTMTTAEVNGRVLLLSTQPLDATELGKTSAESAAALAEMTSGSAWLPALVTDDAVSQTIIRADGSRLEATLANIERLKGTGAGGVFDRSSGGLDDIPGNAEEADGTAPADAPAGGAFTAAWLEFEIAAPGETARVERRPIFDAIGPEARAAGRFTGVLTDAALRDRALALRDVYSVVIQGGAIAPARATLRLSASIAMARRATVAWLRAGSPEEGPEFAAEFRPPNTELTAWSLSRGEAAVLAGTNIALIRDSFRTDGEAVTTREVFDIVANPVGGAPAERLSAGVADTVQEHVLMGAPAGSVNTAARFAADLDSGRNWSLVAPGDQAALDALGLAPEVAALLQRDFARGAIIVAPAGMTLADASWWRIDPRTGETLGMTAAGGASFVEWATLSAEIAIMLMGVMKWKCDRDGGPKDGESVASCFATAVKGSWSYLGKSINKQIKSAKDAATPDVLSDL